MSSFAAHTGLETPLISAEEREELVELVDIEEDETEDNCIFSSSPEFFGTRWDYCCLFCIMPSLLFIQFYVAFQVEAPASAVLSHSVVAFTVFLFVAASYMYKTCIQQDHLHWMRRRSLAVQQLILLTPEILMDVVLGVVLGSNVVRAFEVLLYATMFLAIVVIIVTGTDLYNEFMCGDDDDDDVEEDAVEQC